MKGTGSHWVFSAIVLLVLLSLATGCYREVAPDVTPTPAGDEQSLPQEEEEPDVGATARAVSATVTQQAVEAGESTEETATEETVPEETVPEETAPEETLPTETPSQPPAPTVPPPTVATTPESSTPVPATPVSPTPVPAVAPPATLQTTHTVQAGENLFRIALRYGTTEEAIAAANGIVDITQIFAGQTLIIPSLGGVQPPAPASGETLHVVQAGEGLYRIALRYNLTQAYLAQYNGIADPDTIYVGQVLRIPPH